MNILLVSKNNENIYWVWTTAICNQQGLIADQFFFNIGLSFRIKIKKSIKFQNKNTKHHLEKKNSINCFFPSFLIHFSTTDF